LITPDEAKIKRTLKPYCRLSGHTESIDGLVFKPDSATELCSVGVDRMIMFWDTRIVSSYSPIEEVKPTYKISGVHDDDINCVAWSTLNPNLVATGSNDFRVCLTDIRKLTE
jgi:WD40 repeat protein